VFDISPIQILIVLVIALIVFGPKRLPEMGRSIGRGIRELKGSLMDEEPPPPRREAPAAPPRPAADAEDEELEGVVVPGDTPPRRAGDG
jgi:sec-independent protein translocase protein TatA